MDNASVIPKHWADKLDHKTAYALESSILAYCDILDHDLFFFPEYTNHKMMHIRNILKISTRLIPPESDADLTAGDIAVYILSVLYHDMGMHITYAGFLRILTENFFAHDYSEVYNDRPWPKLWEDYVREARLWNDKIRKQIPCTRSVLQMNYRLTVRFSICMTASSSENFCAAITAEWRLISPVPVFPVPMAAFRCFPRNIPCLSVISPAPTERTSGKCSIPWRRSMAALF